MFELALVKHRLAGNIKLIAFWPWRTVASSIPFQVESFKLMAIQVCFEVLRRINLGATAVTYRHDKLRPRTEFQ
jgi:hypothetical protein